MIKFHVKIHTELKMTKLHFAATFTIGTKYVKMVTCRVIQKPMLQGEYNGALLGDRDKALSPYCRKRLKRQGFLILF